MYEAIVVGGGIVGASAAYHLARADVQTLLIDRRDRGQATGAGAGILSPETSRHESEAWYDFAVDAVNHYPPLVEEIHDTGIEETGYAKCGTLVVDLPADDPDTFTNSRERIITRQQQRNYPSNDRLYDISPAKARERFPPIGDVRRALYYEDGARVDGRRFRDALFHAGEEYGLDRATASAEQISQENGSVTGVVTNTNQYSTSNVVIAGGAWSSAFADQLDTQIPIEPQRGQIVHLDLYESDIETKTEIESGTEAETETESGGETRSEIQTAEWPVVTTVRGNYLVPWPDKRVAVGATRETDSGFAPHTTARGVQQVLTDALDVAPGLADGMIEDIRVGLRPISADGLPVIGEASAVDGAYLATGHGPTGLQLGPYTGKMIAELIHSSTVDVDLSPFAPSRFS
jgi:D-amino-acid dehydrogenase